MAGDVPFRRPPPELRAAYVTMNQCGDPTCGAHLILHAEDDSVIAEAVLTDEIIAGIKSYQDKLHRAHGRVRVPDYERGQRAGIEASIGVVETEEEFPGEPPPGLVEAMIAVGPVENARRSVRVTKASIVERLRVLLEEPR